MRLWLSLAAIALSSASASEAVAQDYSIHATGSVGVAYDDNILGAPKVPPPEAEIAPPIADYAITVAPGVTFLYATPRWESSFNYTRSYFIYARHPEVDATADTAVGSLEYGLSPADELGFSLGVTRARSSLTTLFAPSDSRAEARRPTPEEILAVSLGQRLEHLFNYQFALAQEAAVTFAFPLDPGATPNQSVSGLVQPAYSIEHHTFSLEGGFLYSHNHAPARSDAPDSHQVVNTALGGWSWAFAEEWMTNVAAGGALSLDSDGDATVSPLATAGIYYAHEEGYGASLVASSTIQPSATLSQVLYTHSATLSVAVPIYREIGLGVSASGGIAAHRILGEGTLLSEEGYNSWITDAGLVLAPPEFPLSLSVRYQHLEQIDAAGNRDLDITRNVGTVTIGYFFPQLSQERADQFRPRSHTPFHRRDDEDGDKGADAP